MDHKDCCGSREGHLAHREAREEGASPNDYSEGSGKGFSFSKNKMLGFVILVVLAAGLVATIRWAGAGTSPSSGAGVFSASGKSQLASPPPDAGGHSMDGFSSYDEMMAAHHPDSSGPKASGAAPASSAPAPSGQGPYQGFNTYEEMMAAHHPAGGQGGHGGEQGSGSGMDSPGCGGVSEASTDVSSYGLMYNNAGYNQLLEDAKKLSPTTEQEKLFVGLDVQLPCCGVKALQAKGNCECGHHIALFGLAKKLAIAGYSRDQIQNEINKWKTAFYPGGVESSGSTGGC